MAQTTNELAEKVASGNGGTFPTVNKKPPTVSNQIQAWLERSKAELAKALPKHLTPDRMARVAMTEIRTNPKLLGCKIESLMASIMKAAQEGLEFGTGDAYLVPYGNECQYIRGYRGSLKLIRRSQEVGNIGAYAVYEKDHFDLCLGSEPKVVHKPSLEADRGSIRGFYCVAEIKGQGVYIEWMSLEEINKIRDRSKAKNNGPWVSDFVEMGRKTILKRASKYLPMSVEVSAAIQRDEEKEFGESSEFSPSVFEMNLGEVEEESTKPEVKWIGGEEAA